MEGKFFNMVKKGKKTLKESEGDATSKVVYVKKGLTATSDPADQRGMTSSGYLV